MFFFFLFMMKKIKMFVVELGKYQLKSAIFYYSQIIDSIFTYVLILEIKINLRGFFSKDKWRCQFSGPIQGRNRRELLYHEPWVLGDIEKARSNKNLVDMGWLFGGPYNVYLSPTWYGPINEDPKYKASVSLLATSIFGASS